MKKGVLLINLGSPDHPDKKSVARYLREFLNDPRVIDIPVVIRKLLVNAIITPFRASKTAAAYQKIWTHSGSPLIAHTVDLQHALSHELGSNYVVEVGMRYGKPDIFFALNQLKDCDDIAIIPLFPQYSSAATGSAVEQCMRYYISQWTIPSLTFVKDFYNDPGFIAAFADNINQATASKQIDMLLLSYHGLPERHVIKSGCHGSCDLLHPCTRDNAQNNYCYRAQCFETSLLLAEKLNLSQEQYRVAFQSRLGKTPWIKPYTDLLLPELISQGVKNIAIACPSFVADCLETLEEINIRAREQWQQLGGNEFTYISCINDHPLWVKSLAKMIICDKRAVSSYSEMMNLISK